MQQNKSWKERVIHALIFEILAISLSAPVLAWVMHMPIMHAGFLTFVISLMAMIWNMVFNALFDKIERRWCLVRTVTLRVIHACLFEIGLVALVVPLIAWWLKSSLLEALILDIGLLLFFLPYTFFFNLVYDKIRAKWWVREMVH